MTGNTKCRVKTSLVLLFVCAVLFEHSADACSHDHIRELSDNGKTVSAIAKLCDLTRDHVARILDGKVTADDDSSDGEDNDGSSGDEDDEGLPRGAVLVDCGCWGFVAAGAGQPNSSCRSGYERAVMCPGWCSAGGSPWKSVCR